jgi:hypothetical protein
MVGGAKATLFIRRAPLTSWTHNIGDRLLQDQSEPQDNPTSLTLESSALIVVEEFTVRDFGTARTLSTHSFTSILNDSKANQHVI